MFRIDIASAVSSLPTPASPGTGGYWTNGDPVHGIAPTIIDGDWLNRVQEELMTVVGSQTAITPSKTAYNQIAQAILSGGLNYAVDSSGSANTITAALPVTPVGLTDGLEINVKIANTNTGDTQLNLNGFGAKHVQHKGANLVGGELVVGQQYKFIYNLGSTIWQLASIVGTLPGLYLGASSTTGTANAQVLALSTGGFALTTNNVVAFKAGISNTSAMTINVAVTGAVTIKKKTGSGLTDLVSGDIVSGDDYMIQYDGVYFELTGFAVPTFGSIATLNIGTVIVNDGSGNATIGSGVITAAMHIANSITATQIANGTITGTQIASNVALSGSPTTTTQAVNDISTKISTTAFANPANSLGANGYVKLPSGLIMQWGTGSALGNNVDQTISFPISFPSTCYGVHATAYSASPSSDDGLFTVSSYTTSTFHTECNTSGINFAPFWIAFGV